MTWLTLLTLLFHPLYSPTTPLPTNRQPWVWLSCPNLKPEDQDNQRYEVSRTAGDRRPLQWVGRGPCNSPRLHCPLFLLSL